MKSKYKIIACEEYDAKVFTAILDESGNEIVEDSYYKIRYPNARHSPDHTEVVISGEGEMDRTELIQYMKTNW